MYRKLSHFILGNKRIALKCETEQCECYIFNLRQMAILSLILFMYNSGSIKRLAILFSVFVFTTYCLCSVDQRGYVAQYTRAS